MTEQQQEYYKLFSQGLSVTEIAKIKGKSVSTISRVLKRARTRKCPFSSNCITIFVTERGGGGKKRPRGGGIVADSVIG